jgi:demethylmenaquinone methyltransferase/2-methoxy-6-polyprenyl-1,4-benzoquinol methylase
MSNSLPSPKPPLHGIFTAVPPHYDLTNHIGTLGMDKRWREITAQVCLETKPHKVLDIGCGTGDLTINIARLAPKRTEVIGLDYSQPMLERARSKAEKAGVGKSIRFIEGEASHMPFPDAYFDVTAISFAFRNLTYKNPECLPHLAEVLRVLKPSGRYIIVESSQPENGFIRACFHLYLRAFVKPMGMLISRNRGAYRYLDESIRKYYSPREVRDLLISAGFREVKYHPLFFGAVGIHVALK